MRPALCRVLGHEGRGPTLLPTQCALLFGMISQEKHRSALWALNWVLVAARLMAYQKEDHEKIADLLDLAEYLPCLMLENADRTEHFRECLSDLSKKYPSMKLAVDRFDNHDDPYSV